MWVGASSPQLVWRPNPLLPVSRNSWVRPGLYCWEAGDSAPPCGHSWTPAHPLQPSHLGRDPVMRAKMGIAGTHNWRMLSFPQDKGERTSPCGHHGPPSYRVDTMVHTRRDSGRPFALIGTDSLPPGTPILSSPCARTCVRACVCLSVCLNPCKVCSHLCEMVSL